MNDVKSNNRDSQLAASLNSEYLASLGLCVVPEYSGHGLGKAMMLAAIGVCKHQRLPLFLCVLTSKITQHIATELGFTLLKSAEFHDYEDGDYRDSEDFVNDCFYGKLDRPHPFKNITSPRLCVMMIKT